MEMLKYISRRVYGNRRGRSKTEYLFYTVAVSKGKTSE